MCCSNIEHTHQVTPVISHRHGVARQIGDTFRCTDYFNNENPFQRGDCLYTSESESESESADGRF